MMETQLMTQLMSLLLNLSCFKVLGRLKHNRMYVILERQQTLKNPQNRKQRL